MRPSEVFLSHSDKDRAFATRICDCLIAHGIPIWYSRKSIIGARQWHDEIGAALSRCDAFVVLLSPASVESKWVKRELLFALQTDRYGNNIVPLLYKPCNYSELSWTLPQFQIVDFSSDYASRCRDLLQIWGMGYREDL
ncbi:toll/interleukin-1 receptor domain-containing protein [Candidatus Thiosymbion oneisti]|uniref:toll/interleukin-1 receptor domain-containing protein n=1 Tax=Candidatus Thiosymbion oneisti TaxID=589554 RepID=UPI000B7E630E|nr:toll/interleukin-1 receptor domain-containing protein [Candidatus Thiosymbion oneisti]